MKPASHSVGSLFVNISGSSKGLKRAQRGQKDRRASSNRLVACSVRRVRQAQAAMPSEQRREHCRVILDRGPRREKQGPDSPKK